MPSLPEETQLDDPLYGDFEDYLDGALPEARRREVEALLARSAAARALLEELRTARAWLNGTTWDVPEPARWPSAEAILARAGRRPAAASATRRWWAAWRARWSLNVRSPVWALGAAAGLALLMGGGLWWWLLPPASDETAQSSRAQDAVIESQDGPPSSAVPAAAPAVESVESAPPVRPQNGVAAPGDAAQKEARQKDAPETSRPVVAPPAPTQASPGAPVERIAPPSPLPGRAGPSPPPAAPPAGAAEDGRLRAGRDFADRSEASSPAADAAGARPEAQKETLKEDSGYAAAPPAPAARRSDASPGERARASASGVDASSPVTLRLVVADRARAVEQATAVARAFGGTARFGGDRLIITVPAARVADCAARLRAGIPQAAEGRPLLLTVRARE